MKVIFEIDTNKGERNAKYSRVSPIGQISGLKAFAGREAIVLILAPQKNENKETEGKEENNGNKI